MSETLVTAVTVGSMAAYLTLAVLTRRRSIRARGPSLERRGGLAASWLPAFVWVPYAVVAFRPGPEAAVPDAARAAGLALVVAGAALASWAALTLGRHFDMEVEVHRGHEVVRGGPYAAVRHPVYAGLALHLLGACLATGSVVLLLGTLLVAIPAFVARAATEEALLRAALGEPYARYAREVPMLLPLPRPRPR